MSDMDPATTAETAEGGGRSAEKRILSTVAKAMFRAAHDSQVAAAGESLSKEQRKENRASAWKGSRKIYVKEAKRLVRQLNLSPANVQLRPLRKKGDADTGE